MPDFCFLEHCTSLILWCHWDSPEGFWPSQGIVLIWPNPTYACLKSSGGRWTGHVKWAGKLADLLPSEHELAGPAPAFCIWFEAECGSVPGVLCMAPPSGTLFSWPGGICSSGQGVQASVGSVALPKPSGFSCILTVPMAFGSGPKHFLISPNTLLNFEFNSLVHNLNEKISIKGCLWNYICYISVVRGNCILTNSTIHEILDGRNQMEWKGLELSFSSASICNC